MSIKQFILIKIANSRVSSDPIFLHFSYIFIILLYFLYMYLSKISYISSQNPIFFQNYEKKRWILFWVEISYKHDK